jgi:hypothetical protein
MIDGKICHKAIFKVCRPWQWEGIVKLFYNKSYAHHKKGKGVLLLFLVLCSIAACSLDDSEKTVYVTKSGSKYHTYSCSTIKRSTKIKTTKSEALSLGYTACKVCKP